MYYKLSLHYALYLHAKVATVWKALECWVTQHIIATITSIRFKHIECHSNIYERIINFVFQ